MFLGLELEAADAAEIRDNQNVKAGWNFCYHSPIQKLFAYANYYIMCDSANSSLVKSLLS